MEYLILHLNEEYELFKMDVERKKDMNSYFNNNDFEANSQGELFKNERTLYHRIKQIEKEKAVIIAFSKIGTVIKEVDYKILTQDYEQKREHSRLEWEKCEKFLTTDVAR